MSTSIGPKIGIEGEKEFKKAIFDVRKEFRMLDTEMAAVASQFGKNEKSMESYRAKNTALEKAIDAQRGKVTLLTTHYDRQKGKLAELEKALIETTASHAEDSKEVVKAQREYRTQQNNVRDLETQLNRSTVALNSNEKQFEENTQALKDYGKTQVQAAKDSEEFKAAQEKLGNAFGVVKKAAIALGTATVTALTVSAKAAIDYESAFAGVRKTVEATEEEYAKLSDSIRQMSKEIPTSASGIASIAESAGQLGIETNNIVGFTRTIADLGVATNLTGEEAASSLAKFANITKMPQKDFDRLGSVIVDLGNNLATTEADIVSMGMRLAGAGTQVGMSEAQILSFAGALSSVGIEAEAGGSAVSKVMVNMQLATEKGGKSLDNFAKVAGMSASQFADAYKKDAAGALTAFITGLGKSEEKGLSAIRVLDDMGIKEVRLRDALLRASSAGDLFTNSIELGTKAWEENTALADEAEQRYKTVASQLQLLKNTLTDVGIEIGQELMPIIANWTKKLKEADTKPIVDGFKWIINNGSTIASIAGAIGAGMVTWKVATTITSVTSAMRVWKTATEGMTIAQSALNAVTAANPIGAMAVAIAGAVAAFGLLKIATRDTSADLSTLTGVVKADTEAWAELQAQQKENIEQGVAEIDRTRELWEELQTLIDVNGEVIGSKERAKYITEEINDLAPDSIKWIDDETIAYSESAEAIDNLIAKKRAQIILEAKEPAYKEAVLKIGDKQAEQARQSIELMEQEARVQEERDKVAVGGGLIQVGIAKGQEKILRDMQKAYAENETILGGYYATIQDFENETAAVVANNYEEIDKINTNTVTSFKKATDGTAKELEEQVLNAEINARLMRQRYHDGVKGVTEDMVRTAEDAAITANREYEKIGDNIVGGIEKGVKNKEGGFLTTIRRMALNAAKAAREALDEHSPSRVFMEIGENVGEGLIIGVDSTQRRVAQAARNIGDVLISEEEKIQKQLAKMDSDAIKKREEESGKKHKVALEKKYAELARANKKGKQKVLDEIAKLQTDREKELADASEKTLKDSLNNQLKIVQNFKKEYENAVKEIEKTQENMEGKLAAFGGLFERTQNALGRDIFKLTNLQSEIDAINRYGDALSRLKERGVSDSLLAEITNMSIEDATDYTHRLLEKTDEQYEKYMTLWDEKQALAASIAKEFYKDELDNLKAEFVDKIPQELAAVKDEMKDIGVNAGKGLAEGFASQKKYIKNTFVGVLGEALESAKKSMEIRSPSRKWAEVGSFMAMGLGQGFLAQMQDVTRQIANSIPSDANIANQATAKMGEGIVNGLAGFMPQLGNNPVIIKVVLQDGKELAEAIFDPLTGVAKQRGVAFG